MSSLPNDSVPSSKNTGEVTSKYFSEGKALDESATEFQEPKKRVKGPKTSKQKPSTAGKSKTQKGSKKTIKGQKDIRTVLKSKKNELEAYAKDFDKVCKQSGIDIDSEQLQLAIALSKSLHDAKSTENDGSQSTESVGTQERTNRIRTTLQEYGFKVPEIKIETGKRKAKGRRKNCKLLLITDAERQQIIADKYSQVLFENLKNIESEVEFDNQNEEVPLYDIVSNKSYNLLKSNEIFYVKDLIDISKHSIGTLLRSWSDIPGRPVSPVKDSTHEIKFTDMEFGMDEIDIILSGPIEKAQAIVKSKLESKDFKTSYEEAINIKIHDDSNGLYIKDNIDSEASSSEIAVLTPSQTFRSLSPDLFDDDLSSISDNTKESSVSTYKSQHLTPTDIQSSSQPVPRNIINNNTRKKSNDFMDVTQCVNISLQSSSLKIMETKSLINVNSAYNKDTAVTSQKSDTSNFMERISDDFTEIKNCLKNSKPTICEGDIDLTQDTDTDDDAEKTLIVDNVNTVTTSVERHKILDLTQSSNSNDDTLPLVQISGQKQKDSAIEEIDTIESNITEQVTFINECKSDDNNKVSQVTEINNKSTIDNLLIEEYVYEHSDHSSKELDNSEISLKTTPIDNDIDLTRSSNSSEELPTCKRTHLTINKKRSLEMIDDNSVDYDEVIIMESKHDENSQNQRKISEELEPNTKSVQRIVNHSLSDEKHSLDPINYYEEENELKERIIDCSRQAESGVRTTNTDQSLSNTPSEVFEISDEELNYSMHKSKCVLDNSYDGDEIPYEIPTKNFNLDGISVIDNMSRVQGFCDQSKRLTRADTSKVSLDKSASDSFLPVVEIKGTKVKIKSPEKAVISTPIKDVTKGKFASVQTPNNSEYLIKTQEVTPMLDYASLSTPDRNKELDKYGLKPFKRKRAIQLLTHLYNQTHPILETYTSDDLPSPSKRPKSATESENFPTPALKNSVKVSPRKLVIEKSPKKNVLKSPMKSKGKSEKDLKQATTSNSDKDNNVDNNMVYEETQENPVLKHVECLSEDWVFQKREKAKVHSCRLPLHIAFHNYISTRRCLREAILRYEPINIDVIHKDLVGYGHHRYDPRDLLRFLDKKCITVKTADNNGRNNKRCQRKS